MRKKGISLIVLVITIIVIIILADSIILSLASNNPIIQAKEAVYKSDIASIQDMVNLHLLSNYYAKGLPIEGFDAEIKDVVDMVEYNDKFIIIDGILYCTKNVTPEERLFCSQKGIKQVVYLNNLLVNANFSNGLSGWTNYASSISLVDINGVKNIQAVMNSEGEKYTFGTIHTISNVTPAKYYGRVNMKWESNYYTQAESLYVKLSTPGYGQGIMTSGAPKGTYGVMSGIQQYGYSTPMSCQFRVNNTGLQYYDNTKDVRLYLNSPMMINLTEAFGFGNEPTATEMDQIPFFTKESGQYIYIRQ